MRNNQRTFGRPATAWRRALWGVVLMVAGCAGESAPRAMAADAPASVQQQSPKERQRIAAEMFRERCKKAGVFIHRTVEDVEGIFLMKLRPQGVNFDEQYVLDDPYGKDLLGDGYMKSFLRGSFEAEMRFPPEFTPPKGYLYVEVVDSKDGVRYRYTGSLKAVRQKKIDAPNVQLELRRNPNYDINIYDYVLEKNPSSAPRPRYGVTYEDISTREERDYWIAGSSLKVIDLQTNEVIAERIGYMVDWAQGSTAGGRSPWLFAADNACPAFAPTHGSTAQPRQASNFVQKVLKPWEGK